MNKNSKNLFFGFVLLCSIPHSKTFANEPNDAPKFRRYEDVDRAFNLKVSQKRKEEIDYLKKVIRNTRFGRKNKEPFIMRLAELYWEQAKFEFDLEVAQYSERYEKWEKGGKKGGEPKTAHLKSRNYYTRSIATIRQIIGKNTKEVYKIKALYFLGFNLIEIGKGSEGIKYLKQLISEFRNDKQYSQRAAAKLADFYFEKGQPMNALTYYNSLLKVKDPGLHNYVLYKIAWCYMKLGWGDKALKGFEDARNYMKKMSTTKRSIGLLEEVEKDIIKAVAVFKKPHEAKSYIIRILGKKKIKERLDYLATLYLVKKMRHAAITMYRNIIALDPMDIKNIDVEIKIFDLYKTSFNLEFIKKHISHLIKNYGVGTKWFETHGENSKVMLKLEEMMRVSTTKTHEITKKQIKDKKNKLPAKLAYRNAIDMYKKYLANFPTGEHSYQMRLVYAQLLFGLKMWKEAYKEFDVLYESNPKGEHAKVAALNAVVCLDKLRPQKHKPKETLNEYQISNIENNFIKAASRYKQVYSDDIRTNDELNYKIADIYYNYNHFDKALLLYRNLAFGSKTNQFKEPSIYQIMNIYNKQQDLKALSHFSKDVLQIPSLGKIAKKLNLQSVRENAEIKYASELEKSGKTSLAALQYYDFYRYFPKSKMANKALYNSLVLYRKGGDVDKVKELNLIILEKHPKNEIAISSYKEIANNHNDACEFDLAADFYIKLYSTGLIKDEKENLSLIYNAAKLYFLLNDYGNSEKYFAEIVRKFGNHDEANEALLHQAKIKEAQKNFKSAIQIYMNYFKRVKIPNDELAYYFAKFAKWNVAFLNNPKLEAFYYKKILKLPLNTLKTGVEFFSEAKFKLSENIFNNFKQIRDVPKAQNAMQEVIKQYDDIIKIGDFKWGLASLVRIGEVMENFADVLAKAPLPSQEELGDISINDYKDEVQKVVDQHLKEAENSYINAVRQGESKRVLTNFVYEARSRLDVLLGKIAKTRCYWVRSNYLIVTDNTKKELYYDKK